MTTKKPPAQAIKVTKAEPSSAATVFVQLRQLEIDRAKLDETRHELLGTAKAELVARGQEVVVQLKTLGFNFSLSEQPKKSKADLPQGSSPRERVRPQVACPICGFHTQPEHDRRSHRHQEPRGPFTETELTRRGLVRV